MSVQVRRVLLDSQHDNQKWIALEGYIEGKPQLTKRRTINTAALAAGSLTLEGEVDKLIADVEEYEARDAAVQAALTDLDGLVAAALARRVNKPPL